MPELIASRPTINDATPATSARACESCGAPVEAHDKFCGVCGASKAAEDKPPASAVRRCKIISAAKAAGRKSRSIRTIAVTPARSATRTTWSSSRPNKPAAARRNSSSVLPFTPEQAQERFREWLGNRAWFRPGDLSAGPDRGKLQARTYRSGRFPCSLESRWSAAIGEHWTETETYTTIENGKPVVKTRQVQQTEWWDLAGRYHKYYSGYLVSGSRGLAQGDAQGIQPFHLAALKRYEPYFLAGWVSEEYSVARDEALKICQQEFGRWENENVAKFLPGDTCNNLQVQTDFSQINSDLILLPIYMLSYRYKDKLYRFLVNGQTGKTVGEKPLSWAKIGMASGITILLVFIIMLLLFLFNH